MNAGKVGRIALIVYCTGVFLFLLAPLAAVIPLSFNSTSFLSYPLSGLSLRWYEDLFRSPRWFHALGNSVTVAVATTALATTLGTFAALGLMRMPPRHRSLLSAFLISPLIVPTIVTAIAAYFLYAPLGLTQSVAALILSHTVLATPFVVIVMTATLQTFDISLLRAGASLGASPARVLIKVLLPLIMPGVLAGAVFAFMTSFDEIITAILLAGPSQRTLPLQMFNGVREQISPTITAAATLLTIASISLLGSLALWRSRLRRLRGAVHG